MSLSSTKPSQRWKMDWDSLDITNDPHILGPYYFYSLQLNFCTRKDAQPSTSIIDVTNQWSLGNYCIYMAGDECPKGFNESTTRLVGYNVTWADTDGMLPTMAINDTTAELTLNYCCRQDGGNGTLELPNDFPFILVKVAGAPCSDVDNMTVNEERFDLVDNLHQFFVQGYPNVLTPESIYQILGLCYYAISDSRECYHKLDNGYSYTGTANYSIDGKDCLYWPDHDENNVWISNKYVGDFDNNYCRVPHLYREFTDQPYCIVRTDNEYHFHKCDIPYCDVDESLEEISSFKPVYAFKENNGRVPEYAVDGLNKGNYYQNVRPSTKAWLQVDLEEILEVHQVLIHRRILWQPNNMRHVSINISPHQWDFFNYGALQCVERRNPWRAPVYLYKCYRPLVGQYVTLRNFDETKPSMKTFYYTTIAEIRIFFKRGKVCARRMGMISGEIRDFQLSGSLDRQHEIYDMGRLLLPGAGFRSEDTNNVYYMVDMILPTVVHGIEMTGVSNGQEQRFIDAFTVEYATTAQAFISYSDSRGVIKIFKIDNSLLPNMIRRCMFNNYLILRYLKLNLINYNRDQPTIKIELIGRQKRIIRDLDCAETSLDFGYDVMTRTDFLLHDRFIIPVLSMNKSECKHVCKSTNCSLFKWSETLSTCSVYASSRYNPNYFNYFIKLLGTTYEVFAPLCIKEIKSFRDCSATITESTFLQSPSFPFYYGQLLICTWQVTFKNKFVQVNFLEIHLAESDTVAQLRQSGIFDIKPGQCMDKLTVDGHVITSENDHIYRMSEIYASSSTLTITLVSCARYSRTDASGFYLNLTYTDIPGCYATLDSCSSICTHQVGLITSPAFPTNFLPPTSCLWTIQGRIGQFVELKLKMVRIENKDVACFNDAYVNAMDISLTGVKQLLFRYCSDIVPIDPIRSSWHMMELNFKSEDDTSNNGFVAQYQLVDFVQDVITDKSDDCDVEDNYNITDISQFDTWQRFGNSCYNMFSSKQGLTWWSAESNCKSYDGHLVSLTSSQEVMFLHTLLTYMLLSSNITNEDSDYYMGLRKVGSNGRFEDYQWSDGIPVTFTAWNTDALNFRQSQPDGLAIERCSMLRLQSIHSTNNWHDVACAYDKIHKYICERTDKSSVEAISYKLIYAGSNSPSHLNDNLMSALFACNSSEYILGMYVCDGTDDCLDSSDEWNCGEDSSCQGDSFVCDSGMCINAGLHCDFRTDCNDASDELHCVYPPCLRNEWRCDSGQCIPLANRCDVKQDCFDHSDEKSCVSCHESSFQCYDERCLPGTRFCDGFKDCNGVSYEDEDTNCTRNARASCFEWYSIGKRTNGSYLIDLDTDSSFEVECLFSLVSGDILTVETVLHHQSEAPVTVSFLTKSINPLYTTTKEQIEVLLDRSICRQFFSAECSHYNTAQLLYWSDKQFQLHTAADIDTNCDCPYVEQCNSSIGRCQCNFDWFGINPYTIRKDANYITNHTQLPIHMAYVKFIGTTELQTPLSFVKLQIGPLICREEVNISTTALNGMIVCANNELATATSRCLLDFDEHGEIIGCRDLSHLQMGCDNVSSCNEGNARCSSNGFCIPRRLLCDGIKHCPEGEDEITCHLKAVKMSNCQGAYMCRLSDICINLAQVCDRITHCPQGDDELLCNTECPPGCECSSYSFVCHRTEFINDMNSLKNNYLRKIRYLTINKPGLNLTSDTFSRFSYLNFLNMSKCGIEELEAFSFSFNFNLIVLDMSFNVIETLVKDTFRSLRQLTRLLLKGNPLKVIEKYAFSDLNVLPELDISYSSLFKINDKLFLGLESVVYMNLSQSKIHAISSGTFDNMENLFSLDITGNDITNFDKGIFNGLHSLKEINTSSYLICCVRPESVTEEMCYSPKNEFSSCDDLMKNEYLRAFLWIIGLSAMLGNAFVIALRIVIEKDGMSRPYGLFVSNLSIADLLMGVYLVIIAIADILYRGQYVWNDFKWRNGVACQIAGVLSTVASEASVIFLCLITFDRFLVVKYPFGNFKISRQIGIVMCTVVWIVVMVIALLPLLLQNYFKNSFYSRSAVCLPLPLTRDRPPGWQYSVSIFIVFNLLAFVFIASAQLLIYREIRHISGKVASKRRRQDFVIARKLFFVAMTDFLCWFPVGVMGILALTGHVISGEVYAWIAVFVLPINSALNPFLYTLGSSSFKQMLDRRSIKKQTLQLASSRGSTNRTDLFDSKVLQFGKTTHNNRITLNKLVCCRNLNIQEAVYITWVLASGINVLHSSYMLHGSLEPSQVLLRDINQKISRVVLKSSPKEGKEEIEYLNDIKDLGSVVSFIIKHTRTHS